MRFKSVYNSVLSPETTASSEESRGIFCKSSKNWQRIWRGWSCIGASGCCCRQDVPQRRFRVAVVNRAGKINRGPGLKKVLSTVERVFPRLADTLF